jgi:hypothetical protein
MVYNLQILLLQTVQLILKLEMVLHGLQLYHGHYEEQVLVDTHVINDILEMVLSANKIQILPLHMDDTLVTGVLVLQLVQ